MSSGGSGNGPIPPRWRRCPPMGSVVRNTRFLPFKTPLDPKYDSNLPEEYRFNLDDLFNTCAENFLELGMIVDLTKTDRYYDKNEVESRNCKYVKIRCDGHGECPDEEAVLKFNRLCSKYWEKNPDKYIGVHCTHGFNRTGYLICMYQVEKMDIGIEDAVFFFSEARPYGIYKPEYLKELFEKCEGELSDMQPPGRPEWEDEDETYENTNEESDYEKSQNNLGAKRTRDEIDEAETINGVEYEIANGKKRVKHMVGVLSKIGEHVPLEDLEKIQNEVARMAGFQTKRKRQFPGSQPVSLDQINLMLLAQEPFLVSWKADGTRYMMLIKKEGTYMIDRDNNVFVVADMFFPRRNDPRSRVNNTLLDGEMVIDEDKNTGVKTCRFLIYDMVAFEGHLVGVEQPFTKRLHVAKKEIEGPRREYESRIDMRNEPFRVRVKNFYPIQETSSVVKDIMPTLPHETDGLVLTPVLPPYIAGRFRKLLKWKPPHQNSVDFIFRYEMVENKGIGTVPQRMPLLYVLNESKPVGTLDLTTIGTQRAKDLNGCIVECTLGDVKKRTWAYMRTRTDKSHPNSIVTYNGVMASI
eukprot:Ihof_evm15s60 gene=Ihof_evmTU15s60